MSFNNQLFKINNLLTILVMKTDNIRVFIN